MYSLGYPLLSWLLVSLLALRVTKKIIALGIKLFSALGSIMGSSEGATDNGSSVSDDPELGRMAPELRQSPGHPARRDNKAQNRAAQ